MELLNCCLVRLHLHLMQGPCRPLGRKK